MKLINFISFICNYYKRFKLPILLTLLAACSDIFAYGNGICEQEDICRSFLLGARDMISKALTCLGPPPGTNDAPDICQDATIDTITRTPSGSTYAFKGDFYWKLLSNGKIAEGYPREIDCDWGGLEGNLDASVTLSTGKTYFFKGRHYWRFTEQSMDTGYPVLISVGWKGIPDNLDAALVWSGNGKTYFFKGDKYWLYDSGSDPPVGTNYPMQISEWSHLLADGVDAALQWENNRSFFFKGDQYYRYNDETSEVDKDPPYPLSTAAHWFGCQ